MKHDTTISEPDTGLLQALDAMTSGDRLRLAQRTGLMEKHLYAYAKPNAKPARWVAEMIAEAVAQPIEVLFPHFASRQPYGSPHPREHIIEAAR